MNEEKEYKIEIIEESPNKEYLILKINNEETKIEKVSKEKLEEWKKILESKTHDVITERIDLFLDPNNIYRDYFPNLEDRMVNYFGERDEFFKKFGHYLKYKDNYFFVYNKEGAIITLWIRIAPIDIVKKYYSDDPKARKIIEEYKPPRDICEEFIAIIRYLMTFNKYEIKILEKDPNEKYLIARINNEEVKIEKFSEEELKEIEEIIEREKDLIKNEKEFLEYEKKYEEEKKILGRESKYKMRKIKRWRKILEEKSKDRIISIVKEIKKIEPDPELARYCRDDASYRMHYYFGRGGYIKGLGGGYFLKYKGNYFLVDIETDFITIEWFIIVPKEIYEKNKEKYEIPKDICEEFSAIIEYIMFPKYKIEFIHQDVYNKKYIELKINGEKVKVEKVNRHEKLEKLEKGFSRIDRWPPAGDAIRFKRKELRIKKPLAIYRLMINFGAPYELYEEYCCEYLLKYKGHYFEITDDIFGPIWIKNILFVTKEIYDKYFHGTEEEKKKIEEEYCAPKDICEEFIAIIRYLINNPAMVYIEGVGEYDPF